MYKIFVIINLQYFKSKVRCRLQQKIHGINLKKKKK
jgi:hypothetical protein